MNALMAMPLARGNTRKIERDVDGFMTWPLEKDDGWMCIGNVNITGERPSYHHGDLRSKLIEAALDCIEKDGVAKLSFRKIAVDLGVSHNAPYMHFASKDALLDAAIAQGFAAMRAQIAEAGGTAPLTSIDWSDRVKCGFRAYVAFAKVRPSLYALMHVPRGAAHTLEGTESPKAEADASSKSTLNGLAKTLEAGQSLGFGARRGY